MRWAGPRWPGWLPVDPYVALMLATVGLATLLPARGGFATGVSIATRIVIGLLFFLYGARISTSAARAGAGHWRLHLLVLLTTFALFPALGLAARPLGPWALGDDLYDGLLFLCAVPSTVQSAIALTSIARGNVPAAIFSASFSSIAGIALTPLLVAGLLGGTEGVRFTAGSVRDIATQLLLPFVAGHLLRPWIGGWVERRKSVLSVVDRGSILLVVYTAVSAGVVAGLWQRVTAGRLLALLAAEVVLLALVLLAVALACRGLRLPRADRVTAAFCGSTKSVAVGLPMAAVLFSGEAAGLIVLPLILYHQLQLIVCAYLARRWPDDTRRWPDEDSSSRE
jgi:solute carrier family 10 (sodium/bile acid cotransporter), member 7